MKIEQFKRFLFQPEDEILINKTITLRGHKVFLLSITKEKELNRLWVLFESEEIPREKAYQRVFKTNREEMVAGIKGGIYSFNFHISEIIIQDQKMTFLSSTQNYFSKDSLDEWAGRVTCFINRIADLDEWAEVEVENLVFASFEQKADEEFPEVLKEKPLDISIKVNGRFQEVLLQQPYTVPFGVNELGTKLYYKDPLTGDDCLFYLDHVENYDIWADKQIDRLISLKNNEEEAARYRTILEDACPVDKNLAMIWYETDNNRQLRFLLKDVLDAAPMDKKSFVMYFSCDDQPGINGFILKTCEMGVIPKDLEGDIEIELFSFFYEIQEEIIQI